MKGLLAICDLTGGEGKHSVSWLGSRRLLILSGRGSIGGQEQYVDKFIICKH